MTISNVQAQTSPGTSYYQFETLRDPKEGMSPIARWIGKSFDYEDQSASVVSVDVAPRTRVLRVALEITTAFTGTTAVVVGDGTTADGWIATGTITPATINDFGLDYDSTYGVKGKKYTSGDTIDVSFTGIATAGEGILWMEVISYEE